MHASASISAQLIVLLAVLTACSDPHTPATQSVGKTINAPTQVIQPAELPTQYVAPASLAAATQVQAASRIMGYIREINVVEGQPVKAGDRLFSVDAVEAQGQVDQAKAGLKQAEAAEQDAKAELERFTALFKEEAVTRQQFEKIKLQHEVATSRVAQARAASSAAGNQLRYASVQAPISGVITKKLANAGDLAAPGQPVVVLEDPGKVQVLTHVPAAIFSALKVGQAVPVEIDGESAPIQAHIAQLAPAADPVSQLFLVKLDISGKHFRSGLFARAMFTQGRRPMLAVPETALVTRAGIRGVFVVGADNLAQFRMLRTGEARGGQVEVQAGLNPGERIVVNGAEKLESGDKVGG